MAAVNRFAGAELTGIKALCGKYRFGQVVVCGSGTTLNDLDLDEIPDHWVVVAVNEAIRKLGERADYWVLSDEPIVRQYARYCPKGVCILAMHQATVLIPKVCPDHEFYTVNSINTVVTKNDGFNFFSRGTVLIGAVEMMRYAGCKKFYCFGLDCFRTEKAYYYDGRKPALVSEQQCRPEEMGVGVPPGVRIYVTSRLKNMVRKLKELIIGGLWEDVDVYCVNSPYSQQKSVPQLSMEEFREFAKRNTKSRKRDERRKRAKQKATVQAGEEPAEGEESEALDEPDGGWATHEDGQGDTPVVDRGGSEGCGGEDPSNPDAEGRPSGGGTDSPDPCGDRDAPGGDSDTGDEELEGPWGDGDVSND